MPVAEHAYSPEVRISRRVDLSIYVGGNVTRLLAHESNKRLHLGIYVTQYKFCRLH